MCESDRQRPGRLQRPEDGRGVVLGRADVAAARRPDVDAVRGSDASGADAEAPL